MGSGDVGMGNMLQTGGIGQYTRFLSNIGLERGKEPTQ